ncbi:L-type lectin-domain containing receptor kinase S.6-like [Dorcoceras hygrometricum]|uniref:L-type lectin-domain containing receptor kinase S.6-like n=1 Tax=Dorcoceras hygrometricum TaxID=472368 RepID=A0A2Z7D7C6_9LAMI|nr:L-type lectin-domain containing receptor kinase S.6-like [Dorcoceras hygrometricum]
MRNQLEVDVSNQLEAEVELLRLSVSGIGSAVGTISRWLVFSSWTIQKKSVDGDSLQQSKKNQQLMSDTNKTNS